MLVSWMWILSWLGYSLRAYDISHLIILEIKLERSHLGQINKSFKKQESGRSLIERKCLGDMRLLEKYHTLLTVHVV